ncbi:MAG: chorismate-binding protein, partial [Pyrinomonadaceae bacterium]
MKDSEKKEINRRVIPVVETISADLLTPLGVYLKLGKHSRNSFLLESVEGGESLARYSFIGTDPEMIASGNATEVTLHDEDGSRTVKVPMLDFLREHFAETHVVCDEELPAFVGGAIGYFGFDCAGWFEPSLRRGSALDESEATFMFFKSVIAFDHAKQVVKIVTLVFSESDGDGDPGPHLLEKARRRNASIRNILENDPVELPRAAANRSEASVSSNWSQDEFENAVNAIKELIRAGECYQVVISQCFSRPTAADPVSIYRAMRSLNPSPYMFLMQMPDSCIIGASPEMLVKCSGRNLEYRPIAGTRPRGKTIDEDAALAKEMQADQKEVAEHLMLVDLGRNDLGRVAEYGTVRVENLMSVEKYSH